MISVTPYLSSEYARFMKWSVKNVSLIPLFVAVSVLPGGCGKNSESPTAEGANGPMKIRVGYIGLTCEAPIFTAFEKGFFKEENLDVELVKCEWQNYKDVLALGGYDIT